MRAIQALKPIQSALDLAVSRVPIPTLANRSVVAKATPHVVVKNSFAGLNFIDVYQRTGLYKLEPPAIIGAEGGGEVVESDLPELLHKRVVYFYVGSYAEYTLVPASRCVLIPDDVSTETALALTVQGLTAHYLTHSVGKKVEKDSWILVHAAGSGTGRLLVQVASRILGANVVGTSSKSKLNNVKEAGAKHAIDYTENVETLVTRLRDLTPEKRGYDAVFDGVGKSTYQISLDSLRPRGICVLFGNASGPVPPIDPLILSSKGSLLLARPRLHDFMATREESEGRAKEMFQWHREGKVNIEMDKEFTLETVGEAHQYVEGRKSTGKSLIRIAAL